MTKMLCPYCDHEIKKAGRCEACGSKVKKPIVVETTAVFDAQPSAQPGECGCDIHSEDSNKGNRKAGNGGQAYGAGTTQTASTGKAAGTGKAGSTVKTTNTVQNGNSGKPIRKRYSPLIDYFRSLSTVMKIVIIYFILSFIFAFIRVALM